MQVTGDDFGFGINLDTTPPTIALHGEIDVVTAPYLIGVLAALIDEGHRVVVVDVNDVSFLDARGARAIAAAGARARAADQILIVRAPSALLQQVLELTGAAAHVELDSQDRSDAFSLQPVSTISGSRASLHPSTIDLVDASLDLVASIADATITRNAGISITLERHGHPMTVTATTERAATVDEHQYQTGQGPCLDAARYDRSFYAESLATETRWPDFVPVATRHGIAAILSTPLHGRTGTTGSLNLYATVEHAFGDRAQRQATQLANDASRILTTAEHDITDQQWNHRYRTALDARRTIHQAQGVIMARHNATADDALARITHIARDRAITTLAYAAEIVTSTRNDQPTNSERTPP